MTGEWKQDVKLRKLRKSGEWNVPKTFYMELLWIAVDRGYKNGCEFVEM